MIWQWRPVTSLTGPRWVGNLIIGVLAMACGALGAAVIEPLTTSGVATPSAGPVSAVQVVAGVLGLDLAAYWIHRVSHRSRFLWCFHAVHHSDPELDASTTLRHHPVEAVIVGLASGLAAMSVGIPAAVIAATATLTFVVQAWAHANLSVLERASTWLGYVIVTPPIHRLHHSPEPAETDSNYGLLFSFWDRIFATYRSRADDEMKFGLASFGGRGEQRPDRLLAQPFRLGLARL